MTIIEYNIKVEERDTKALDILFQHGEEAYWDFMSKNKITYPQEFVKAETKEPEKKEHLPHLYKDEMQVLREQYYYGQPGIISNY